MKSAKGLYFGANSSVFAPVSFVHRLRRRYEKSRLKVPNAKSGENPKGKVQSETTRPMEPGIPFKREKRLAEIYSYYLK